MQRDATPPVPLLFRTARLFFAGCVSGGVVATGFAIARDLGVPIRPERLLASLRSSLRVHGVTATFITPSSRPQLVKPEWAPPPWLFGPVWTVLYLMMGVAALLVWRSGAWPRVRAALSFFVIHLAVNAVWCWLFFHWHLGAGSFAGIVVLWLMIVGTILWFARFTRAAVLLLVPYLAWVTFAAVLNWTLWQRNPALLS